MAPQPPTPQSHEQELQEFIQSLSADPERESVVSEIGVLQSIYGEDAVRVWHPPPSEDGRPRSSPGASDGNIRYEVFLNLPPPNDDPDNQIRVLVSIPPSYPINTPPQLQLLSRYIGPYGVDSALFGLTLRTYISKDAVEWAPDSLCVFDGLEYVKERCAEWYTRLGEERSARSQLDPRQHVEEPEASMGGTSTHIRAGNSISGSTHADTPVQLPPEINIVEAEPILDRKSAFVGRACRISDPSQVPLVLSSLMSDRRIARAAHPIINAWRCRVGNALHQDNDDDGETAAGGRLAHLLQIMDIDNVLVIVTRYFGGIHLGPDRFKHINQAARNALEAGGFLDSNDTKAHAKSKKKP